MTDIKDLVARLRKQAAPYLQEWRDRVDRSFGEPVYKNGAESLAYSLGEAADGLEQLQAENIKVNNQFQASFRGSVHVDIYNAAIAERDAYKKAKEESDERFQTAALRAQVEQMQAEIERLNRSLTCDASPAVQRAMLTFQRHSDLLAECDALRARCEKMEKALSNLANLDCGDNSCLFASEKTGMRTNGGCRCLGARSLHGKTQALKALAREALAEDK